MRKNFILLLVIMSVIFVIGNIISPKIIYAKLNNASYETLSNDKKEEIETSDCERIMIVQLMLDYQRYNTASEKHNELSSENFKERKQEHRNKAKEYHKGNNSRIIEKIKLGNYQDLYISSYSPFIDITYDYDYFISHKDEILSNISKEKLVKEINLLEDVQYENSINFVVRDCDAETVYETRSKTGAGVVVGILEPGKIDVDDPYLADVDITIRSSVQNILGSAEHTTQMAQLIAGPEGIAPGVSLLNAYTYGSVNEEIDWMVENNADVINMSFGNTISYGTYNATSAYVDYIAYTYDVVCVAAAGNDRDEVSNPALGYNVITVGSCDNDVCVNSFSSWEEVSGPEKPTICAPGYRVEIYEGGEYITGTSASCAIMSGYVALLLEQYPVLASEKARLIALLTTNAKHDDYYNRFDLTNGFDEYVGSGLFSYQNFLDHYNTSFNYTNTNGVENSIFKLRQVYLQQGQLLRASFVHLAKATGSTSETVFTDYDIYIRDANGNNVYSVTTGLTNVNLVHYEAPATGYYQIVIKQYSEMKDTVDYTALAYSIE